MLLGIYPGYLSADIRVLLGDNIRSEQRDGCGAVGHFLTDADGKTHLLSNGDYILQIDENKFIIYDKYSINSFSEKYEILI